MTNNNEVTLDSILAEFRDLASSNREMCDHADTLLRTNDADFGS